MSAESWTRDEFEKRLRGLGNHYHIHHPYQVRMNAGDCTREQIRGWVANRFYYQISIPQKDAALMSNCPDREVRREWIVRMLDHDGRPGEEGGIDAWLALGRAVGFADEELWSQRHVLPGVRFAVDAYVNFVRRAPWQEGVCSSLTELFAPEIHRQRLANWPQHYDWIDGDGLRYFRNRLAQARRDVEHGLAITLDYFNTRELQQRAMDIVRFKCDVLWSMLDSMWMAYIADLPPYHHLRGAR